MALECYEFSLDDFESECRKQDERNGTLCETVTRHMEQAKWTQYKFEIETCEQDRLYRDIIKNRLENIHRTKLLSIAIGLNLPPDERTALLAKGGTTLSGNPTNRKYAYILARTDYRTLTVPKFNELAHRLGIDKNQLLGHDKEQALEIAKKDLAETKRRKPQKTRYR